MVPDDDRGLLLGDGLFETVLAVDGRPEFWDEHMARMIRGCAVIGLEPPDPKVVEGEAGKTLEAAGLIAGRAVVRVTLTAGSGRGLERRPGQSPRLIVTASAAPAPGGAARLATAAVRRNDGSPVSRLKSLSYLDNVLARREAAAVGADEALMRNTRGEVACAAAANVFWIAGGRLYTPGLECGVLDGIMRARAIAAARELGVQTAEVRTDIEALRKADAAFLTNSVTGVRAVREIDGRPMGEHLLIEAISSRCR